MISNFKLICYYDNKTNDLVKVEHYEDGSNIQTDIDSYKYGYDAKIYKPEELLDKIDDQDRYLKSCFEEKTKLNLIIDRLLEAGGFDTNTAGPYEFEEVYKQLRYMRSFYDNITEGFPKKDDVNDDPKTSRPENPQNQS